MTDRPEVHIAVCADRNILPGLHVTLSTTLRHLDSGRSLEVHLVHRGLTDRDIERLRQTLDLAGGDYTLRAYSVPIDALAGLTGVRGNIMTWARFLLPSLLGDVSRVLYLDADLAVLTDVSSVYDLDLAGAAVGLVYNEEDRMQTALEKNFFEQLGFDLAAPYYNAGVLLMDLDAWRDHVVEAGLAVARQQNGALLSHDQTAINVVFYGSPVIQLEPRFNRILYAGDPFPSGSGTPEDPSPAVYHFLGAPKPWDFLGEWVHWHSRLFEDALSHTALRRWRSYTQATPQSLRTAVRNAKAYAHALRLRRR